MNEIGDQASAGAGRGFSPAVELIMAAHGFVSAEGRDGRERLAAAVAGVAGETLPILQRQLAVAAERGLAAPALHLAHVVAGLREVLAVLGPVHAAGRDAQLADRRRLAAAASWGQRADLQ